MAPQADIPFIDPKRKVSNFRPLKAWKHFRNLVADKEDTEQVFYIIDSLRGSGFVKRAERFWNTDYGRKALEQNEYLPDILDDHDTLKKLPAGTVGRAYVDFMEREGLTAAGLVAEFERFNGQMPQYDDIVERYSNRSRDIHDMYHVLTGYGRDALGEQCVLAFTYSQSPNLGILFIAWAGGREILPSVPKGTPVYAAIREAQQSGKHAGNIVEQDIIKLLSEPLAEARKRLNIPEPVKYQEAHQMIRAGGVDPFDLLGKNMAAA